ncbi:MerR family transcriptional regulator [Gimibacter soli]
MVRSQGMNLTIGKFAKTADVGVETIRFYQRKGLLETPEGFGGMRRYGPEDVRRLRFIRKAQKAGFTLEEIKELIDLDAGEDRQRARELARARMAKLDEQIAELARARDSLKRLATACSGSDKGPCPILVAFDD